MTETQFWTPAYSATAVEIKQTNLVHGGFCQVYTYELRHQLFSGEWSAWLNRELIRRSHAAAVLLYDPEQDAVILIEQFRVGLLEEKHTSPWMLEIVAGLQDQGESGEETVMREAQEEAGCTITRLIKIGACYNTPGVLTEKTEIFCGICEAPQTGTISGLQAEHEDIKVHVFDRKVILEAFEAQAFLMSASTMISLQWLQLHPDL